MNDELRQKSHGISEKYFLKLLGVLSLIHHFLFVSGRIKEF